MRVAQIIPGLHYGGMERLLHDLTRALHARDFDVHVIVVEGFGRFADGLERVAELHQVPPMGRFSLLYPAPLVDLLRRVNPDLVHSHAGIWFKASRGARLAGVPAVVHTEHGRRVPDTSMDRLIDNLASRSTDVVVSVSDALADLLRRRVVHDPAKVRTIINGVDCDRLHPPEHREALRQTLGIAPEVPLIGTVGRLEPVKNYRLAVDALARLGNPNPGSPPPVLMLVGDGSERSMLEALARSLGVFDQIRFMGFRDNVDQMLGAYDLYTLVSRSEGTSVSLLEAMSCGLCPVVTDVGGNRAVLGPDLAHLVVRDNDADHLAATWGAMLRDPAQRLAMGHAARERVLTTFSLRLMVDRHVELYHELLATRHARAAS